MKLLLDTHIFLWLINKDKQLKKKIIDAINNTDNQIFLSVASVWECVIKYQLGKLRFSESPEIYIPRIGSRKEDRRKSEMLFGRKKSFLILHSAFVISPRHKTNDPNRAVLPPDGVSENAHCVREALAARALAQLR